MCLHHFFTNGTYTVDYMKNLRKEIGHDPLGDPKHGHTLTRGIIDTIHEPLVVLGGDMRVIVASRSFYKRFQLDASLIQGKLFNEIAEGQWAIPSLQKLLLQIIPHKTTIERYEIEHTFKTLGTRTMLINGREIKYQSGQKMILLSFFDITEQRTNEAERENLLMQKVMLLKEMRHRIANSLQLIASILLLKAETVTSKVTRAHLEEAHERIMSIATVQQQLEPVGLGELVEVAHYLKSLCTSLSRSMIGKRRPITISVQASKGSVLSDTAVSLGLITTELIINALKHAFPNEKSGRIIVRYDTDGSTWALSISDNGVGIAKGKQKPSGLGTSIVGALANQLHALIRRETTRKGTTVSILYTNA